MRYVIRLEGGIGNQMFQYAHARALQMLCPGDIVFDTHTYTKKQIRHLSLNYLNIIPCLSVSDLSCSELLVLKYKQVIHKIAKKISIKLPSFFTQWHYEKLSRMGVYMQYQYKEFDSLIMPNTQVNYVTGTYLAPCFFKGSEKLLLEELKVKEELSGKSLDMLKKIEGCNSVCVHIRLGDYLSPQWKDKLYLCTENYYLKAVDIMSQRVKNPVFFVFSNRHKDIEWIRRNYKFPCEVVYVDLSNPDYADLQLMYSCKHFVLSNSTYSWWGQWLSNNKSKVVVAPSRFNNVPAWDMSGIYSEDWITIDV